MKVLIYGTPQCIFCAKAKELCETYGAIVDYQTVGTDITKEELQEKIGRPIRTVPQIFINEDGFFRYIGGYNELVKRLS